MNVVVLESVREALKIGVENTRELLAGHDATLGRTHRHNRLTAEAVEADLGKMLDALAGLDNLSCESL